MVLDTISGSLPQMLPTPGPGACSCRRLRTLSTLSPPNTRYCAFTGKFSSSAKFASPFTSSPLSQRPGVSLWWVTINHPHGYQWLISQLLVTIFQCLPVNAVWDRFKDPSLMSACTVNLNQFFNGNSIPNIVTDAMIIVLPMPFIWQLHLPKSQKIALTNVFILGAL